MAIIDASGSTTLVDLRRSENWDRFLADSRHVSENFINYRGEDGESYDLDFHGYELTADIGVTGELTGGTITQIDNDLDLFGGEDIFITDLNLDATWLNQSVDVMWVRVLAGDDIFYAADNALSLMFGDGLSLAQGHTLHTGDDVFYAGSVGEGRFFGDIHINSGTVFGGNDIMYDASGRGDIDGLNVGDVAINYGHVEGGQDEMYFRAQSLTTASGDVTSNWVGASTIGGNDLMVLDRWSSLDGSSLYGDVQIAHVTSTAIGGHDHLYGSEGSELMSGDYRFVAGVVEGGNDLIFGYGGNDELYGDARSVSESGLLLPGNDIIYGGDGNDVIAGDATLNIDWIQIRNVEGFGDDHLYGESGADTIYGQTGSDYIDGGSGNDWLNGGRGHDSLFGGSGNDQLFGSFDDDVLEGGAGADVLDGGFGSDTAAYTFSSNRVNISLLNGTNLGSHAINDTLISIENLTGSEFGDILKGDNENNVLSGIDGKDILTGFAGNDEIFGGIGRDILIGGEGADVLDGGADIDQARYNGSNGAVYIDLGAGTASGGHADGDKLIGVENLFGSNFGDILIGFSGNNVLFGHNGDDTLEGGGGLNKLFGGAGADSFVLGSGFSYVMDFEENIDRLDVSAYGISTLNDLTEYLDQVGNHTRLKIGADTLLVLNTDIQDIVDNIDYSVTIGQSESKAQVSEVLEIGLLQQDLIAEFMADNSIQPPFTFTNEQGVLDIVTEDEFRYDDDMFALA